MSSVPSGMMSPPTRPPMKHTTSYAPQATMKAVHFGAGNIGRGFVAEFLHKSGYEVVFVDVQDKLIKDIQESKSYKVTEIGSTSTNVNIIENYRALNTKEARSQVVEEIATADVVTCAVGPNILKFIAAEIAEAIDNRKSDTPLTVIACENMIGGTDALAGFVKSKLKSTSEQDLPSKARFANSAIDRIVPTQDEGAGLDVKIEKFYEWCVDRSPFKGAKGGEPPIHGIHYVDDLEPYIERKLYTVNTSHATAAYFGHAKGLKTVQDAMKDPEIVEQVRAAIKETARLIVDKHHIDAEAQNTYVEKILKRISNPHMEDFVDRVGRAPIRKLGKQERFIGPAAQLAERGESVDALLKSVELCLLFQNVEGEEESEKLAQILKEKSSKEATAELTGLGSDHPLFDRVEKVVERVQLGQSKL